MRTEDQIDIKVKLSSDAKEPILSENGFGYYLFASGEMIINPLERRSVGTGVTVIIPNGWVGRIVSLPNQGIKHGLDIIGDSVYFGEREIVVSFINLNAIEFILGVSMGNAVSRSWFSYPGAYKIRSGDKIAEIIFEKCAKVNIQEIPNY